ncbi:MAG: S41 family peptidase [Saprospiraceae bacterium]
MKSLLILLLCLPILTSAQFNLDFEILDDNNNPKDWDMTFQRFGAKGYEAIIDTETKYQGNHSIKISLTDDIENSTFGAINYVIPAIYEGKSITLKGYLKADNVKGEDAMAGIWLRIDNEDGRALEFENMGEADVKGTFDWKQFEITLPLSGQAHKIHFGAIMDGEGTIWADALEVFIDETPLAKAKKKPLPAALEDKEFDNGSKVVIGELTPQKIENLKVLGLVWGFLKYHHPAFASGDYNVDYELFRIMPKVVAASNTKKRSKIISKWIKSYGEVKDMKLAKTRSPNAKLQPDLAWIKDDNLFSPQLIDELEYIKKNRNQDDNYYIGMAPYVGNPKFKHESPYMEITYPDDGFRLLALYRYWNIIQYYFPYKHLIKEDWKAVLEEFVPKFAKAKNELEYNLLVLEIIARVHDTHASVWGKNKVLDTHFGEYYGIPEVQFVENKAVIIGFYNDSLSRRTKLQIGDVITKVNGVSIENLIQQRLKYTPASNYPTQLRDIGRDLLRTSEQIIEVEIDRNGQRFTKKLETYDGSIVNVYRMFRGNPKYKNYELMDNNIGYINLGHIKGTNIDKMMEEFKNTKGIVIDIRSYPSEFMVFTLGKHLVPKATEFVKFTSGHINNPGLFTMGEPLKVGDDNPDYYKGKVIVLINAVSQSQAEYTTMAFRAAPNTTVIGSTTAAADGNISGFSLPGGIRTGISGIGVYYPDGTETQHIGIVPDIEVQPTIDGIKAGRDELLEKAVKVILEK